MYDVLTVIAVYYATHSGNVQCTGNFQVDERGAQQSKYKEMANSEEERTRKVRKKDDVAPLSNMVVIIRSGVSNASVNCVYVLKCGTC
jgi:hypothetical protein